MPSSTTYLLLALAALAAGCQKPVPPHVDAAVSVADAAAAAPNEVGEPEVRKLLDAWLATQNSGDFRGYEALYADRFEGIRRSGTQTANLDRARWMKERERMFRDMKPAVAARDVAIALARDGATLTFTQSWIAAAYRDEGPKRIVLVRSNGRLEISREEMLRSIVINPGALPAETFAFAVDVGTPHLVISTRANDAWATGAPARAPAKHPVVTRRAVNVSRLPPELASWVGKKVELFGKAGLACAGSVDALLVVGRVDPSDGTRMRWNGVGEHESERKPSSAEVAEDAWNLSGGSENGGRILVAEVKTANGETCAGALWGRVVVNDKPMLVAARPADAATKAAALAELQKTKAYAELEARYRTERAPTDPPRWIDFDARTTALVLSHPSGTIVTLSITAGTGCGVFGGTLSAAWRKDGPALRPLQDPSGVELAPLSAGDVDGDGKLDLIFEEGLVRSKGNRLDAAVKLEFPLLGCGC